MEARERGLEGARPWISEGAGQGLWVCTAGKGPFPQTELGFSLAWWPFGQGRSSQGRALAPGRPSRRSVWRKKGGGGRRENSCREEQLVQVEMQWQAMQQLRPEAQPAEQLFIQDLGARQSAPRRQQEGLPQHRAHAGRVHVVAQGRAQQQRQVHQELAGKCCHGRSPEPWPAPCNASGFASPPSSPGCLGRGGRRHHQLQAPNLLQPQSCVDFPLRSSWDSGSDSAVGGGGAACPPEPREEAVQLLRGARAAGEEHQAGAILPSRSDHVELRREAQPPAQLGKERSQTELPWTACHSQARGLADGHQWP